MIAADPIKFLLYSKPMVKLGTMGKVHCRLRVRLDLPITKL